MTPYRFSLTALSLLSALALAACASSSDSSYPDSYPDQGSAEQPATSYPEDTGATDSYPEDTGATDSYPEDNTADAVPQEAPNNTATADQDVGGGELDEDLVEDLDPFARAYFDVSQIQQGYAVRIQQASNDEEMQSLQQQYYDEAHAAIERHGLTVERFTELSERAHSDMTFQRRVDQKMLELQQEESQ